MITDEEDLKTEIENVKTALRACNYPDWTFKKVEEQMKQQKEKNSKRKKNKDRDQRPSKSITLPYVKGLSEAAIRIFKKFNRTICLKPAEKLGQKLFKLKDKSDNMKKANSIYKVPCKNCDEVYIGETARPLYVRIKEHHTEATKLTESKTYTRQQRKSSNPFDFKSAISEHACTHNHVIDWDNASCVEQVSDWKLRGIKEAIHIRSTTPNMNRPQGERHLLPHVWDSLLTSKPAKDSSRRPGRGASRATTTSSNTSGTARSRGGGRGRGRRF
mgnify:CR=1 FL=1